MENKLLSAMAIDALGEMMNISLGSSATAVSNMLDQRVDITTPTVSVVDVDDFELGNLEPAMGVEIKYVSGLEGSNIMLLRRSDIKVIVDILMGMETPEEEFELNELTISAVCEVMNQMMGAASTALSDFLGFSVNISTPLPFELDDMDRFKREHLPQGEKMLVIVRFSLKIEDALESEFMNILSVRLAKELLAGLGLEDEVMEEVALVDSAPAPAPAPAADSGGGGGRSLSQEEIEKLLQGGAAEEPAPAPAPAADSGGGGGRSLSQEEIEKLLQGGAAEEPAPAPAPAADSGGGGGRSLSQEEIEKLLQGGAAEEPAPAPAPAADSGGGGKLSQEEIEKLLQGEAAAAPAPAPAPTPAPAPAPTPAPPQMAPGAPQPQAADMQPGMPMGMPYGMPPQWGMMPPGAEGMMPPGGYPMYYPPYPYPYPYPPPQAEPAAPPPEPKVINTKPMPTSPLEADEQLTQEQAENLDLIMEVPLQVTVEIGRTRRKVQEILGFAKGSLVVLDKLAGDQVDLFVNGKCIARGDVVVIDDNFGVRITEIVQKTGLEGAQEK